MAFLRDANGNLIADNGQTGDAYRVQGTPASQPPASQPQAAPPKFPGLPQQQGMGLQQRQPPIGASSAPAQPPPAQAMSPMPDGGAYPQPGMARFGQFPQGQAQRPTPVQNPRFPGLQGGPSMARGLGAIPSGTSMARPGAILASPGQSEYGNGTDQTSENDMNVYGSDAEVPPAGGPKSQIGNTAKGKTYYGE